MQTKLVYVLTCEEEDTYIEQALISIYSARYHNPSAYIVLLVDDLTDKLLIGKRAEVLEYISEKLVFDLPIAMKMLERSRWLKTQVRLLIKGDFLFIDTDTIITHTLDNIDNFPNPIGAVLDSHMTLDKYSLDVYDRLKSRLNIVNVDISKEKYYFSSGVMYVKDSIITHKLYEKWFNYWFEGLSFPFIGDQPYLCKANIELNHIITELSEKWNCVMYTYPEFDLDAYILHFSPYNNRCFLFDNNCLNQIRKLGLEDFKPMIICPQKTYITSKFRSIIALYKDIYDALKFMSIYTPMSIETYLINNPKVKVIKNLFLKLNLHLASLYICSINLKDNIIKFLIKIKKILGW